MIFHRVAVLATILVPSITAAQVKQLLETPSHVMVGSTDEDYLRYLQLAGLAAQYPWSLREFSQPELARLAVADGSHPRTAKSGFVKSGGRSSFAILPVNTVLRFNSEFPYGSNDGAVWAGRGLTSALDLGFAFRLGPISGTFNPIVFSAQNASFHLQPNGTTNPFADPLFPGTIDRPQRFGTSTYSRLDPGETTLRVDLVGLTAGVSTANMGWGPMENYPYVIGGNAPGFPHAFVGTSSPVSLWIAKIHGRAMWGELSQSAYSPVQGTSYYSSLVESGTRRFATGAVAIIEPRGMDGLELGVARFFHSLWPKEGIPRSYVTKPFQEIFKVSLPPAAAFGSDADRGLIDNQLASAFARWAFPKNGFEAYGEYGREDHNWDRRDFVQEPDHTRSYGLGIRKIISFDSLHVTGFRAEMINYEMPTLGRNRGEGAAYEHSVVLQGHTNRGQVLGSDTGVGTGGGSLIAWDRFDRNGSTSIQWTRTIRQQRGVFYLTGAMDPRADDVQHAVGVIRSRYMMGGELTTGATLVREYNRNFESNAWNFNLVAGFRLSATR